MTGGLVVQDTTSFSFNAIVAQTTRLHGRAGAALFGPGLQAPKALHGVRIAGQDEALFKCSSCIVENGKVL
ncbi:MAG: hypothetical protein ABJN42_16275, partial [Roseibium sp.]|uniref:hypothetical protein n=1 Tax=Roseibium sp. TaxID=1936156 RepID=UPI003298DE87